MDRERLKEIHQTDLTESRINEDFVDWLKTKGPTWLLAVLVAVCAYLAVDRWQQHKSGYINEAWGAYYTALQGLPDELEDVAAEYPDVGQLANLALLQAADRRLTAVQTGLVLGTPMTLDNPNVLNDNALPDDERDRYLTNAARLYEEIVSVDDESREFALYAIGAMNGRAAVAECRGDADTAREWYDRAAARAGDLFPVLAAQAQVRSATADQFTSSMKFPPASELPERQFINPRRDVLNVDPGLRELLMPPVPGLGG